MAEKSSENQAEKSVKIGQEKSEDTASDEVKTEVKHKEKQSSWNKAEAENLSARNKDKTAKQIFGISSSETAAKKPTKIPVKSLGKQLKKGVEAFATKNANETAEIQKETSLKTDLNSLKLDHHRSKTEPHAMMKQPDILLLKTRESLENELLEKTKEIDSLRRELSELKVLYEGQKTEIMQLKLQEVANSDDVDRKIKMLSDENYELRERLLQKDIDIEKLQAANEKAEENIVQKILKKENVELHHEKEQLKVERDRLRHTVNEKQDKADKLVAGLKDMEDKLYQAKRALEDRVTASTRLEDRLAKLDSELNRYRERFGKLENQNKSKRFSEKSRNSRSRSLSPSDRERLENEQEYSESQVTMLRKREAKLLSDRRQLEKSVNVLSNKITELEDKLQKSRPENRPTHERSSQTDLGTSTPLISTMKQGQGSQQQRHSEVSAEHKGSTGDTMRKCRGIVNSLGKFFEEMIQNSEDTSSGGSKSRRTTIAARRANELLNELSTSLESTLGAEAKKCTEHCTNMVTIPNQQSTVVNTDMSKTIWDKLCDEVAQHEFTFDPESPPLDGTSGGKYREMKRAERGLQRMYQEKGEARSDEHAAPGITKEDASKMMDVSRKQTESVMKDLLKKHQGEIRTLLENATHSSPLPTMAFDISNPEIDGSDEATIAVKELDSFKAKTTKVQSLILKLQEVVECVKRDKQSVEQKLQCLANEIREKDTLLQAKTLELRRRHGRTLESEKSLQTQIGALKDEKTAILKENARLHDVCRQKDLEILQRVQEIKAIHAQNDEREKAHQQNLSKMKRKVEEAWGQYESVKSRAEKRTAEFSEAAEKLKASQGYLLDLWQTLKTVDNVVEANEQDEL